MSMALTGEQLVELGNTVATELDETSKYTIKNMEFAGHDIWLRRDDEGRYVVAGISNKVQTQLPSEDAKASAYRSR